MRTVAVFTLTALLAAPVFAQQNIRSISGQNLPFGSMQNPDKLNIEMPPLEGAAKLRFVVAQLELRPDQEKVAKDLIENFQHVAGADETEEQKKARLMQAMEMMKEIQAIKESGDEERANQMMEEVKAMTKNASPSDDFYGELRAMLDAEQTARLERTLDFIRRRPDAGIRPVDVLIVAREQNLSSEQQMEIEQIYKEFRAVIKNRKKLPPEKATELLTKLLDEVCNTLQPAQADAVRTSLAKSYANVPGTQG